MIKKKFMPFIGLVAVAAFLASCTTMPVSLSPSSTYIAPNDTVTEVGPVSGSAFTVFIFGLPIGEQEQIAPALKRALKSSGSDAIIEVKTEFKTYNFMLFHVFRTRVYGTGVKIQKGG
ncbi:MAG: hypothetical protein ABIJ96_14615 [Elusimicrobiota bacterium]